MWYIRLVQLALDWWELLLLLFSSLLGLALAFRAYILLLPAVVAYGGSCTEPGLRKGQL